MSDWREVVDLIWAYAADVLSTPERATAAILAISTIGLWWSTRRLWRVTRIAAEHIPHVSELTCREARSGPAPTSITFKSASTITAKPLRLSERSSFK